MTVQVLKLYAWEESFKGSILDIREKELQVLKASHYLNAASAVSWFMAPYLVRFVCVCVCLNNNSRKLKFFTR